MENYIGMIEHKKDKIKIYSNDESFLIKFYFENKLTANCFLIDAEHVYREIKFRKYKNFIAKTILKMI